MEYLFKDNMEAHLKFFQQPYILTNEANARRGIHEVRVVDNHSSKVKQDDEHSVNTIFKPLK